MRIYYIEMSYESRFTKVENKRNVQFVPGWIVLDFIENKIYDLYIRIA
jgi:hypothetical protein